MAAASVSVNRTEFRCPSTRRYLVEKSQSNLPMASSNCLRGVIFTHDFTDDAAPISYAVYPALRLTGSFRRNSAVNRFITVTSGRARPPRLRSWVIDVDFHFPGNLMLFSLVSSIQSTHVLPSFLKYPARPTGRFFDKFLSWRLLVSIGMVKSHPPLRRRLW